MLRDDDIIAILKLVDFEIGKSELGALFRKEDHPNYVECGDQILRNFLNGLVIHLRGTKENPKDPRAVLSKKSHTSEVRKKSLQSNQKKKSLKSDHKKKPGFKAQQRKRMDTDISNVKYKNKKKSWFHKSNQD